jgi:L-ascorbate metabolism protein UlaG (beta-lactamase superfamily)
MVTRLSSSSWIKIKQNGKVIYFDPGYSGFLKNYSLPISEFEEPGDLILISHAHKDHLQLEALNKIWKPESLILAPKVCKDIINKPFRIVKPGEDINLSGLLIHVVHAYNTIEGHSTIKAHHKGDGVGYVVQANQTSIYHSGDTDFIPEMQHFPKIDIALLPIGGTYTMDIDEAIQAVSTIQPDVVIPMHFLKADPKRFKKLVEEQSSTKVILLNPGESAEIDLLF